MANITRIKAGSQKKKKESDKKYNSSAKGIKRTIKFNLGKEKRNTN